MAERADAMHAIEFLNKRGANIKFSSVAEPPSESEWHTKGECFRPHVPIIHASRNVTSAPSYAESYFRAGHNPATLRDCDFLFLLFLGMVHQSAGPCQALPASMPQTARSARFGGVQGE